jgi:hypothetical protein
MGWRNAEASVGLLETKINEEAVNWRQLDNDYTRDL